MAEEKSNELVAIPLMNYNALQGQIGNMGVAITNLQRLLVDADLTEYVPEVEKINIELGFFARYLPPLIDDIPF